MNNLKKQGKRARKKRKIVLYFIFAVLAITVFSFAGFLIVKAAGKSNLKRNATSYAPIIESDTEMSTADLDNGKYIYKNGQKYEINNGIYTILFMGVDKAENESKTDTDLGTGGQTDAIFLLVLDTKKNKMNVIGIPRDTMTDIDIYDVHGQYYDTIKEHLALQYAYGDGRELSCQLTEAAVGNLMYHIPINAYVSIDMQAIPTLNNEVGGVEVTVLEDISDYGISLKKDTTKKLNANEAYWYVRARDCSKDYSAQLRLERQKQYLLSFISTAEEATRNDMTLPLTMFNSISENMVTDLTPDEVAYLSSTALNCSFSSKDFSILEGTASKGDVYEEYEVDTQALYDLVLNEFYEPVTE